MFKAVIIELVVNLLLYLVQPTFLSPVLRKIYDQLAQLS